MNKKPALSVSITDCEVQTFRSGGPGGQNQNKTDSGVRVIHRPSGARAESREERSQLLNKRNAFRKMAESIHFRNWVTRTLATGPTPEERVIDDMRANNLKVEIRREGKWEVIDATETTKNTS